MNNCVACCLVMMIRWRCSFELFCVFHICLCNRTVLWVISQILWSSLLSFIFVIVLRIISLQVTSVPLWYFQIVFFLLSYCVVKAVVVVVIFVPTCMKTYFLVIACSLLVITTSCVASFTLTLASSKLHRLWYDFVDMVHATNCYKWMKISLNLCEIKLCILANQPNLWIPKFSVS